VIHAAASIEHDGLALATLHRGTMRGLETTDTLRELVRLEGDAGRGHVTVWCPDAETVWRRLFTGGSPLSVQVHDDRPCVPVWGSQYMVRAQWGRVHLRDLRSWTAASSEDLQAWAFAPTAADATLRWHRLTDRHLRGIGAEHRGTAAAAAHRLWRDSHNDRGAWRYAGDTDDGDFARRAYFGGRTTTHHVGLIAREGHVPGRLQKRFRLPVQLVPDGHRLWRIDQRSAYPHAMTGQLAWVWGAQTRDPVWREDVVCGVVDAVVSVGPGADRLLPIRVRQPDGPPRTGWLRGGAKARGTWTATALREALRGGSVIHEVKRAHWWHEAYRPFGDLPRQVYDAAQLAGDDPPVKDAIKSLTRRLYGRLGTGRSRNEWMTVAEYLESGHTAPPRYMIGSHVCVPVTLDEYPAYSVPAWAAEITSRVNVTLHRVEAALLAAGLPVYYTDTDSLLFSAPAGADGAPELPPEVARRMGPGLGGWRVDWRGSWALILGPKWYALSGGRTALSGIPKELQAEVISLGYAEAPHGATVGIPDHMRG
jgi:hypothetical protein